MATEKDNPKTGLLATITLVVTLAGLALVLAVTALVRSSEDEQVALKSVDAQKPFDEMRQQQHTDLSSPVGWADKDKGTVSVPIDRAMQIVVKGLQADPDAATAPALPEAGNDAGAADAGAMAIDGGDAGATVTDGGAAKP